MLSNCSSRPHRLLLVCNKVCSKPVDSSWAAQGRRPNPQRQQRRLQRHQQEQLEGAEHLKSKQLLPAQNASAGKGTHTGQVATHSTGLQPSSGSSTAPAGKTASPRPFAPKHAQEAKPLAAAQRKLKPGASSPQAKASLSLDQLALARVQALYAIRGAQHPDQVVAGVETAIRARQASACIFTAALEKLERLHLVAQQQRHQQRPAAPLLSTPQRTGGGGQGPRQGHGRGQKGQQVGHPAAAAPHRAGKAVKAARRAFAAVFDHAVDHLAHADPAMLAVMARTALALGHRVAPAQQSCIVAVLSMQLVGLCQRSIPGHCLATFAWATFGRWELSADDQMALLKGVVSREGHLSEDDLDHVLLGLCRLRSQEGEGALESLQLQGGGAWDVVKLALDRWGGDSGAYAAAAAVATGAVGGEGAAQLAAEVIESVPLAAPAPDEERSAAATSPIIGFAPAEVGGGGMPAVLEGLLRGLQEQQHALHAVATAMALHDGLHMEGGLMTLPLDCEGGAAGEGVREAVP